MATALLFPGQGLHYVGMGQSLAEASPAAAAVFVEADEVLGFGLSQLCWQGPAETLTLTEHAQPAILTHSIAALRALQERRDVTFEAVVGHSLGEWTALVAAGVLSLADAVRLVRLRGRFMQEAVPAGVGAMAVVMGLERSAVEGACATAREQLAGRVVDVAALNGRTHVVVSGHADAVTRAGELARDAGAMSVSALPVSAPFHCGLMAPAAELMAGELAQVELGAPGATIWSTVSGEPVGDGAEIRGLLLRQFVAPVLWQPTIEAMFAAGVDAGLALGPGKALKGMVRRVARGLKVRVLAEASGLADTH